ncbi:thyrotropin-releasing hormone receptor [Elysia marginata]|uniref:Thyrotropin-releasing hormone receptor n=1 Tax=Elysia marginata TaxID=1093978 RepID=A0AAV4GGT3_9GAST|nr:thyrotropin-releasing hormone receptor [Elysia marginata]
MASYGARPGASSGSEVFFQALQASAASVTSTAQTALTAATAAAAAASGDASYAVAGNNNNTVLAPLFSTLTRAQHPGILNVSLDGVLPPGNMTTIEPPSVNPLEPYTLYRIATYINRYYLWVIFAFGFPGNIVSFMTILHMKPFSSPTIYVAALALVDNSCLLIKMLFYLLTKYDVRLGDAGCGTISFFGSFLMHLANWLLVAMTLERCLAICLPLRVGTICTRKVHIASITATCAVLVALNTQAFVTFTMLTDKNGGTKCSIKPEYSDFFKVWFWVDAMIYAILPAVLLIVMNSLIIRGIRRSAQIQRELTGKASQAAETMKQQKQITIMLVIVCLVFLILITPHALFYAIQTNWEFTKGTEEHALYLFVNQVIFVLSDATHAVNFYLYFFSTRRFRKRCLETIFYCCYWSPCRGSNGGMGSRRRNRKYYGGSTSGLSKSFRLSMTDVTSINPATRPAGVSMYGENSLLTSSTSSLANGRFLTVNNGDSRMSKRSKKLRDELV